MIYLLLFFILLLFIYHFDYKCNKKYKYFCFYFLMLSMILLAGLRYRIGVDTIRYEVYYKESSDIFSLTFSEIFRNENRADPLYVLLSSIARTISDDFWVLQLLQASLVNVIFFRFVKRNTNNVFLAIMLFYVILYLNYMCEVMREACAVSMFLLAWEFFKKEKWIKYYILCVMAFLFHTSSVVLFFLPLIVILKMDKLFSVNFKTTSVVLIGFLWLGFYVQESFFEFLQMISINELNESLSDKVARYGQKESLTGAIFNWKGIVSIFLKYICYPFWAIISLKQLGKNLGKLEIMVSMNFIFSILMIAIAILYRFNNYFIPFSIISISNFVFNEKILTISYRLVCIKGFITWTLILCPLFFVHLYEYVSSVDNTNLKEYMRYYPYSSVLSPELDSDRERLYRYHGVY